MASAASSRNPASDPTANVGYYEEYSDPDVDLRQPPNPHHDEADEDDEDEEDEEEDDFITRPRRDSPPPIPYQPAPGHDNNNALKRKASDPTRPPPSTRAANGGAVVDSGHTTKRLRPEPLEPSILCAEPLDEFVQEIADWVWRVSQGRDNIEVEAKVGMIVDTRQNARVNLPVLNETILAPDYPEIRFSSDMTLQQHAAYNTQLNKLVERTNKPGYLNSHIRYEHTRLVDTFYAPPSGSGMGSAAGKIRVTTDEKTGKVKECVQKTRIADLNVYSPKRKMDWRVSVSTETPAPLPLAGTPASNVRRKDRLSYTHQSFKVDLTQVTPAAAAATAAGPPTQTHELEIEFADSNEFMAAAKARGPRTSGAGWTGKESEVFDELVRVFVNNIRILVRNAG